MLDALNQTPLILRKRSTRFLAEIVVALIVLVLIGRYLVEGRFWLVKGAAFLACSVLVCFQIMRIIRFLAWRRLKLIGHVLFVFGWRRDTAYRLPKAIANVRFKDRDIVVRLDNGQTRLTIDTSILRDKTRFIDRMDYLVQSQLFIEEASLVWLTVKGYYYYLQDRRIFWTRARIIQMVVSGLISAAACISLLDVAGLLPAAW